MTKFSHQYNFLSLIENKNICLNKSGDFTNYTFLSMECNMCPVSAQLAYILFNTFQQN